MRDELREDAAAPRTGAVAAPARPVIEIQNVWLSFDQPVFRGLDMEVAEGETLLVLGESGTGKSTLLKLIMRMLQPDRGRIRVLGHDVAELSFQQALDVRKRIGMVFQGAALFDSLTAFENVAYPLRENTDLEEDAIARRVLDSLEFVDLEPDEVASKLPAELSGGMKKRVGIARAVVTEPELVLYDEPTAGLDPLTIGTINDLVRKLQRELGVTSLIVTHDIRAGFRMASRVSLLREGKLYFDGSPEDMVAADDAYIKAFLS